MIHFKKIKKQMIVSNNQKVMDILSEPKRFSLIEWLISLDISNKTMIRVYRVLIGISTFALITAVYIALKH